MNAADPASFISRTRRSSSVVIFDVSRFSFSGIANPRPARYLSCLRLDWPNALHGRCWCRHSRPAPVVAALMFASQAALVAHPFLLVAAGATTFRAVRPLDYDCGSRRDAGLDCGGWCCSIRRLPIDAVLGIIAYFVLLEGYCTISFIRRARGHTGGVTHARLLLASIGVGVLSR